ncbi:MAG: hypothetical protein KatS3mg011_0267 [Acidimicrobiia bacterium]|nr:MAG: hypothetical protein KatS3mg011_0267 [Acidimicrobiia bacterium]
MTTTTARAAATIFRRPTATTGLWSWITTVDHKKIGIMYGYTAFVFFFSGARGPGPPYPAGRGLTAGVLTAPSYNAAVHHARHHDDLPRS